MPSRCGVTSTPTASRAGIHIRLHSLGARKLLPSRRTRRLVAIPFRPSSGPGVRTGCPDICADGSHLHLCFTYELTVAWLTRLPVTGETNLVFLAAAISSSVHRGRFTHAESGVNDGPGRPDHLDMEPGYPVTCPRSGCATERVEVDVGQFWVECLGLMCSSSVG
jgi:hypothetical protein